MESDKSLKVLQQISDSLKTELNNSIKKAISSIDSKDGLWITIPSDKDALLSVSELASLVIKTSNVYTQAARFNGIVKAELDKAEGLYKKTFREALDNNGKNAESREAIASKAAEEHWAALQKVRYVANIAQAAENAARVASESARKLLDKATNVAIGDARVEHGQRYDRPPHSRNDF